MKDRASRGSASSCRTSSTVSICRSGPTVAGSMVSIRNPSQSPLSLSALLINFLTFLYPFAAEEFLYQDHLGRICLLNAANRSERVLMSNMTFVSTSCLLAPTLALPFPLPFTGCLLLICELNKYLQHVIYDLVDAGRQWLAGRRGRGSYLKCTHLAWQPNNWQALLTDTHSAQK